MKLQVAYAKRGQAKYFGHLELVKIFIRAFRRAHIPLRFTEGFHPAPKVSFEYALPVGTESLEELFFVDVPLGVAPGTLVERVNEELPNGLTITACSKARQRTPGTEPKLVPYSVTLKQGVFFQSKLRAFWEKKTWPLTKRNRKGRPKTIDLRPLVKNLVILSPKKVDMTLEVQAGHAVRPTDVLGQIFDLSEDALKLAIVLKG